MEVSERVGVRTDGWVGGWMGRARIGEDGRRRDRCAVDSDWADFDCDRCERGACVCVCVRERETSCLRPGSIVLLCSHLFSSSSGQVQLFASFFGVLRGERRWRSVLGCFGPVGVCVWRVISCLVLPVACVRSRRHRCPPSTCPRKCVTRTTSLLSLKRCC